jgi:transcriptional regulator with XRE-family HTH domain
MARDGGSPIGSDVSLVMGREIRRLRQARGISLRAFASMTGLSAGFLSLVERGKSSVGMRSLGAIAQALDTSVSRLLQAPVGVDNAYREPQITRAAGEPRAVITTGRLEYRLLSSAWPDRTLEPLVLTLAASGAPRGEPYGHRGEEFAFVVKGRVVFIVDGQEHRLGVGDSIHLQSGVPHEIQNDSGRPAQVLFVSTTRLL